MTELIRKHPYQSTRNFEVRFDPDVWNESEPCKHYSGKCIYDRPCSKCPLMIQSSEFKENSEQAENNKNVS